MKGENKPKSPLRDKLILVGIVFGILSTIWVVFTYIGGLAKCEDVKQSEQRTEKIFQKMDEKIDRSIGIMDQKSKENERLFDFKLLALEKKQIDEEIYQIEKNYGSTPKDPVKKADLERLKRRREEILMEQKILKEKK